MLIVTNHSAYNYAWTILHAALIVDSRNAVKDVSSLRGTFVRA